MSHPALNALFNLLAAACLVSGWLFIRRKMIPQHRAAMLGALACSAAFLVSYLVYHYRVGSVGFTAQGWIRPVYFGILISHTILAAAIVPMAAFTLVRALRGQFDRHRRIARWTLPVWLYVSATGVLIYWLLYHAYAPAAGDL